MDVFYPLKTNGSRHNNLELRYSLRSIEKNLSGFDRVFISTQYLPEWLTNVEHIQMRDDPMRVPDWNIKNKVYNAGTEDFLFLNDDHFILEPYNANTFPNYYHSTLDIYCRKRGKDGYGLRARNTLKWLQAHELKLLNFDIHYPIVYNLTKFREVMDLVPWDNKNGFIVKSLYGNYWRLPGTYTHDNKVNSLPGKLPVFSTYPHMKQSIFSYLEQKFPEKSRFEL